MPRTKYVVASQLQSSRKSRRVPRKERRCFQMHVSHHIRDLHYPEKQAVAIAYAEEKKGKLKGVCRVRKLS